MSIVFLTVLADTNDFAYTGDVINQQMYLHRASYLPGLRKRIQAIFGINNLKSRKENVTEGV